MREIGHGGRVTALDGGAKAAWFKDSEGNTYELTEVRRFTEQRIGCFDDAKPARGRTRVRPLDPAFLPPADRRRWEEFVAPEDRNRLATAVLLLFLPPILYYESLRTSLREIRANLPTMFAAAPSSTTTYVASWP